MDSLNKGEYIIPVSSINNPRLREYIEDFIYADTDAISASQRETIKKIIRISKSIYDINQTTKISLVYKLLDNDTYDSMLEKYKSVFNEEPFQTNTPSMLRTADHDYPELVGTLDKAYTVYNISKRMSIEKYLERIFKIYRLNHISLLIMPKYDGSSMSATFKVKDDDPFVINPKKGTSRGDFLDNKGVDMSAIIKDRHSIRSTFRYGKKGSHIGIQYEIMVTERQRKLLSKIAKREYDTRRAASAAAIKRIVNPNTDSKEREELLECVSLVPVNVDKYTYASMGMTWYEYVSTVLPDTNYGDININMDVISGNLNEVLDQIQELAQKYALKRKEMNFSIDGIVISIIDEELINAIGRKDNKNQWQIALKFGAMSQRTRISDYIINPKTKEKIITDGIITTHGKAGYLGHNITFEPVEFDGVTYNKAPVSTLTRFKALDPHIGDEVIISYNGDVMGYIQKDDTCIPSKHGAKVVYPLECDFCRTKLKVDRDMLLCDNPKCEGNQIGSILTTIGILGIDLFGDAIVEGLVKSGVNTIAKFLQMDYTDLAKSLKGKTLENCYNEYKNKIKLPVGYDKVLNMLQIPTMGARKSKLILDFLGKKEIFENIKNKDIESFANTLRLIPGIDKSATIYAEGMINKQEELFEYIKLLNVQDMGTIIYDKIVLISGFRKNEKVEKICERKCWKITDSGKYDMLVVTPDRLYKRKANDAREKGKQILTVAEFIETYDK